MSPARSSPSRRKPASHGISRPREVIRKTDAKLLGALAIAMLAFALYIPGFNNSFAYDAEVAVQQDTRIHSPDQPAKLLASSYWAFDQERLALYRPLVTLSFATDWALHDGEARGFHLTNALAHALASVLLFFLLTGFASTGAALAGAALFAAHPVNSEAVASIVGRADIFAATFTFAALLAWLRLPPRGKTVTITVSALFLLALASKESAIMLPALLILGDAATGKLRRESVRDWLRERALPLAALTLVLAGYMAARVAVLGVFAPASLNPIMAADPSNATRIRTALQIWPEILRLLTVPRTLLADYGPRILMPAENWTLRALAGLALLTAIIGGGGYAFLRGHRRAGLALLWTPVALLPVSNLILPIGVLLAERTLYITAFAVALVIALAIDAVGSHHTQRRRAVLAVCAIVCLLFSVRTVTRLPAWSSTDTVFTTLFRDRPDSYRAQWQQARMAAQRGDITSALAYYETTITLWPDARPVYIEAGTIATEANQQRVARLFSEQALQRFPDDPLFLRRLAVAAINLSDTATARNAVKRGLKARPDDPLFNAMQASFGEPRARP